MIKIILLGSFCIYLLLYHPGWVLLAGLICGGFYLLRQYNLVPADDIEDRENNLSRRKEFITYEERQEKEMANTKFKEGFQDDPKWQAQAKKAYIHVEKAQELEEARMRELGQNIKDME